MRHDPQPLTSEDRFNLDIALDMGQRGVPIWTFAPARKRAAVAREFDFPRGWSSKSQSIDAVASNFRPGWALAAGTGVLFDLVDVDPRNGGRSTFERICQAVPPSSGHVSTPGHGDHWYVAAADSGTTRAGGIDYLGRGAMVFLPGTRRPKYSGAGYNWVTSIVWSELDVISARAIVTELRSLHASDRRPRPSQGSLHRPGPRTTASMLSGSAEFTAFLSNRAIAHLAEEVASAPLGSRNKALNDAAYQAGQRLGTATGAIATRVFHTLADAALTSGLGCEDPAGVVVTIRTAMRRGADSHHTGRNTDG